MRALQKLERVKGIEPSRPAWKAGALPLSYTRIFFFWWKGVDSNHRTQKRADLQSAAINHSATFPHSEKESSLSRPDRPILCKEINLLSTEKKRFISFCEAQNSQVIDF